MKIFKFLFHKLYNRIYSLGWDDARQVEYLMRKHAPNAMHERINNEAINKTSPD